MRDDINLTLFLWNKNLLGNQDVSGCQIIEGNVLNEYQLTEAL